MLLLLDIDGVMVKAASWKKVESMEDGFYSFIPKATESLRDLISKTGASIVLTSSHKSTYSLYKWKQIFKNRGIETKIDKLEDNPQRLSRKDEILRWIEKKGKNKDFVIIDDDKSLHDLPIELKNKVVFTNPYIGLNNEVVNDVINVLQGKSDYNT